MAIVLALGSGLIYGVSDYVGGRSSRRTAPVVISLLAELSLLLITLAAVPAIEPVGPSAAALWWGMVGGVTGSLGVLGLYLALSRGNMTVVAPITGVVAAAVPVMVGVATGERPSALAAAGIVLALGAVLLIGGALGALHQHIEGATVVLSVLVGAGFGMLFVAYSRTGDDAGLWPLLTARFAATPVMIVAFLLLRSKQTGGEFGRHAMLAGLAIGLMIGAANGLYLLAARRGLLSLVAVLVALYPASTVALAATLDGERATRWQLFGMVLAVGAVALITVGA